MSHEEAFSLQGERGQLRGILHHPEGADRGWTVLLVQGYFSSNHIGPARMYVQLGRLLARCGAAVLRLDPYGVGNSDGDFAETTFSTQLADYRRMLDCDALRGRRLVLLGHSLGGNQAVHLAAADPLIERLLLISPTVGPFTYGERLFSPEQQAELLRSGRTERRAVGIQSAFLAAIQDPAVFGLAGSVQARALIIRGSADEYFDDHGVRELLAALRGARLLEVAGADHNFLVPGARTALLAALESEAQAW